MEWLVRSLVLRMRAPHSTGRISSKMAESERWQVEGKVWKLLKKSVASAI